MQFHQLYCFTKVAEKKSFSRAAAEAFLSQSTVSTHVSNLESYYGEKLFDRLGKEVVLTPFGEKLYYWAVELLKLKDMATWDLSNWTGKLEGYLHIHASSVPALYMLPQLITHFSNRYPNIKYCLTQMSSRSVADSLVRGESDLGLLGEIFYPEKLDFIPYAEEQLVLITPSSWHLEDPVSVEQLAGLPFVLRKDGSGTQAILDKLFKAANLEPAKMNILGYFDSVQVIKQMVKEGMAAAIISEIAARDYGECNYINIYKIKEVLENRKFYFAYNRHRTMSPLVTEFINFGSCFFPLTASNESKNP